MTQTTGKNSSSAKLGCLVILTPFLIVGTVMLWMVMGTLWNWYQAKQWVETPAYILSTDLEVNTRRDSKHKSSSTYQVTARYRYTFNGFSYESEKISVDVAGADNVSDFHQRVHSELQRYEGANTPFRCYVNPNNPKEAILYRTARWDLLGFNMLFVMGFLGVVLTILSFIVVPMIYPLKIEVESEKLIAEYPDQPWLHRVDWQAGRVNSNNSTWLFGIATFSIPWNIVSLPAWFILYGMWSEADYSAWWVAIFPLIGVLLLWMALYRFLRYRKFGTVILKLDAVPCTPGSDLCGQIQIPTSLNIKQAVHLKLECMNNVTTGSGKKRQTTQHILWSSEYFSHDGQQVSGKMFVVPVHFKLPIEAQSTRDTQDDKVFWCLKVHARLSGINCYEDFDIPVFSLEVADFKCQSFDLIEISERSIIS